MPLDKQGGQLPVIDRQALKEADFITLPEKDVGTNCANCQYDKGGICQHPELKGQPVNERNCCGYWDAPNTLRAWKPERVGVKR
jgi:hypothetical protein